MPAMRPRCCAPGRFHLRPALQSTVWLQHQLGRCRMSEFVFNIGQPGVGALGFIHDSGAIRPRKSIDPGDGSPGAQNMRADWYPQRRS